VAALVDRGLTNRRIDQELSLSEHMVANHAARVLRKLNLGSRSQITAWLMDWSTLP
jgi:DNA-binding CsgD family transcriptional regulator